MTADEQRWYEERAKRGWDLPPKASWPFRLPIIRHVRAGIHRLLAGWMAEIFYDMGEGDGTVSDYDRWIICGIAKGWR